jgi:hypothetical protein
LHKYRASDFFVEIGPEISTMPHRALFPEGFGKHRAALRAFVLSSKVCDYRINKLE